MRKNNLSTILLFTTLLMGSLAAAPWQNNAPRLELLDVNNQPVTQLTDGDDVMLQIRLAGSVEIDTTVAYQLMPGDLTVSQCVIKIGSNACKTPQFNSLGWFWLPGGISAPQRAIRAIVDGQPIADISLTVAPRPVVMVHGFSSNYEAWTNYLGPDGFLAKSGVGGYAVGDGQFAGAMNTGNIAEPSAQTNTIAQNAAILGEYIRQVKAATGAQKVDLLAHSMGGLISRFYIDRVMPGRDVGQLIMLGSPMAGTDCANLPAALGLYLPAVLEIRPGYVTGIFNQQIFHRKGVSFHALAGIPIIRAVQSPCTGVPSDIAVARDSVAGIDLDLTEQPVIHTNLNASDAVYGSYVLPLLQTSAGGFVDAVDTPPANPPNPDLQFTRIFTGHVDPGSSQKLTIHIEAGIQVANFAMYDFTRSLDVSVQGASGNTIELNLEKNGLMVLDDPEALFYLGYGFENPKPGPWVVTVLPGERTPPQGADFAILARFQGGADWHATLTPIVAQQNESVQISAWFDPALADLSDIQAVAIIRQPDGETQTVALQPNQGKFEATWLASQPGLYGADVQITASRADGSILERAVYLAAEVQPKIQPKRITIILIMIAAGGLLVMLLGLAAVVWLWRRTRRKKR